MATCPSLKSLIRIKLGEAINHGSQIKRLTPGRVVLVSETADGLLSSTALTSRIRKPNATASHRQLAPAYGRCERQLLIYVNAKM